MSPAPAVLARRSPLTDRLASLVRDHRSHLRLTQFELASRLGTTQQTVARWERGFAVPDLAMLVKLADELGFSLDELRASS